MIRTGMRRVWGRAVMALAGLALAPPAVAQDIVTEAEFLAAVDSQHPALVSLRGELARAVGERRGAGLLDNPEIAVEYEAPSDAASQTTVKMGWKPPLDGRRGARIAATEARVDAAEAHLAWAHFARRAELRAAYAEWAIAQERGRLMAEHLTQVSEIARRFHERAEHGEGSGLAARRAALVATEIRGALAAALADLAQARAAALALRSDLSPTAVPRLSELAPIPAGLELDGRTDIDAQRHTLRASELESRFARRIFAFPSLELGWTRIDERGTELAEGPFLGLSLELPLFDRNQGSRTTTSQLAAVETARLTLLETRARAEVEAALAAYEILRSSVADVEATVDGAPQLAGVAWTAFAAGETSLTDLLDTLRAIVGSQLTRLDLHSRALAAHRDLELKVGRPLIGGESR